MAAFFLLQFYSGFTERKHSQGFVVIQEFSC